MNAKEPKADQPLDLSLATVVTFEHANGDRHALAVTTSPLDRGAANTIETFIELPEDVNVFYIINDTDDIRETFLSDDPIWQSLPFVQEGRFLPLGGDTWTFGGTQSVQRIVTRSTEQITGTAE